MKTDAFGFIQNLDGCVFAYGKDMSDLTIQPPGGGRIGLNIGDKIRTSYNEHDALVAVAEAAGKFNVAQTLHDEVQSVRTSGAAKARHYELNQALAQLAAVREGGGK